MYVLRTGVAWRDVPAETVGCSVVTAWRRLRGWTEAGVWPRLHTALLTTPRRAGLLDLGSSTPAEALHPQRPHQPFRASPSETGQQRLTTRRATRCIRCRRLAVGGTRRSPPVRARPGPTRPRTPRREDASGARGAAGREVPC
ncbi:transposase [Streptomyces bobili]|uniref:transposase n=1 Tax=Streptomyces bobili TaxID=67280 RepID=UPI003F4D9C01